ncbi:flavodoxin family protein [Roseomonas sp. KE2513]|uniref:NAD(P)H-dependent oxidoreductase n=1 Tax=Roseomonas sp. KE2513 TaxID=2479202 RepID=UPI0018DFF03E|nr:NAD(P)H-dependent oxidoreductase [Roseomonas sp. KE2513]MBI0534128.1 flavodoxin family protein [Roseomonas sp. KE2513]
MHALIVTSHPDASSFTHAVAHQVAKGFGGESGRTTEMADLAAEGFDPRFNAADRAFFNGHVPAAADILAEQRRIDRADLLVLVYPVYWWSMPGLMKGWIDRVFTQGWAYDDASEGPTVKKLGRLSVQLVGIGGADGGTYARHGYTDAMRTQIDHGIFGYCGAPVVGSDILLSVDAPAREKALRRAAEIGRNLAAAVFPRPGASNGSGSVPAGGGEATFRPSATAG